MEINNTTPATIDTLKPQSIPAPTPAEAPSQPAPAKVRIPPIFWQLASRCLAPRGDIETGPFYMEQHRIQNIIMQDRRRLSKIKHSVANGVSPRTLHILQELSRGMDLLAERVSYASGAYGLSGIRMSTAIALTPYMTAAAHLESLVLLSRLFHDAEDIQTICRNKIRIYEHALETCRNAHELEDLLPLEPTFRAMIKADLTENERFVKAWQGTLLAGQLEKVHHVLLQIISYAYSIPDPEKKEESYLQARLANTENATVLQSIRQVPSESLEGMSKDVETTSSILEEAFHDLDNNSYNHLVSLMDSLKDDLKTIKASATALIAESPGSSEGHCTA